MRLSVIKTDPGYNVASQMCRVYLDGEDVSCLCFTADEELGEAHCYVEDKDGKLQLTDDQRTIAKTIRRGVVRIAVPAGFNRTLSTGRSLSVDSGAS